MKQVKVRVHYLSPPIIRPTPDGGITPYSLIRFPDEEDYDDILVSQWNPKGYPYDDLGRVRQVVKALEENGYTIVPDNSEQFATLTQEECTVLTGEFTAIEEERK